MATNEVRLPVGGMSGTTGRLSGARHRMAVNVFMVVVLAHWAEHLAQAYQIWALGWTLPQSRGVLGLQFPWLVKSEWLHYGYAVVMLVALVVLRHGFTGRARRWWGAAMWIQAWHHVEHLLLLIQALTGAYLLGAAKPSSIAQLVVPRVELHLFYNTIVFIPMVVAMVLHLRPTPQEQALMHCACAPRRSPSAGTVAWSV